MTIACPHCREVLESTSPSGAPWKFCPHCGGALGEPAAPATRSSKPAAEGTRGADAVVVAAAVSPETEQRTPETGPPVDSAPPGFQLDTGGAPARGPQVKGGYDPERDRRVKKRVGPPGAMMVAAALSGMVTPSFTLLAMVTAFGGATTWEQVFHPLAVMILALLSLAWFSFVCYAGVLLRERKRPGVVTLGIVMLLLGAAAGLVTAFQLLPCYVVHVVLSLVAAVWAFLALSDMEVKLVMRDRTYGPRR